MYVHNHNRLFKDQDAALVKHLGQYLEAVLKYTAYNKETYSPLKKTILNLLNGQTYNNAEKRQMKKLFPPYSIEVNQNFHCLVGLNITPNFSPQYVAYQVEQRIPGTIAIPFESVIVILVYGELAKLEDSYLEKIKEVCLELEMSVGCSDAFDDFFSLIDYYNQASTALQLGITNQDDQTIYLFKEYALQHFFQFGCSILPAKMICADCIKRLAKRDENAVVSYCDTLRVYLSTGLNSTKTAQLLNIQRNTFLARLERIIKRLDLDLDNPKERLYVEISLLLIESDDR